MTSRKPDTTFQVGDLLNNTFRIEAVLGSGGTSEVFRARNEISGRLVALKVLKAEFAGNEDFLVLMKREEEMRDIRHDAVVGYSENHRTADGHIYLVMDYVDGPSLEARMKAGGMSAEDLLVVGRRVAQGLHAAHERRIVHRDLSPDNIILKDGDPARAVIIDFGIAKDATPGAATIVGSDFAGKFTYAAPEQLAGTTDARSDIYSLGVTLLATFRGAPPRVGNNLMEVIENKKLPLDISDVPEPLHGLLARMIAPAPEARFQSSREILDTIARLESGDAPGDAVADLLEPATAPPEEERTQFVARPSAASAPASGAARQAPKAAPARKGRGVLVAGLLVLLLAAGGGAAWFLGLFGAALPVADPYVLTAEQSDGGVPTAGGFLPDEEALARIEAILEEAGGNGNMSLARGNIVPQWADAVAETLSAATELDSFRLQVENDRMRLEGTTADVAVRDRVDALFSEGALPEGMVIDGAVQYLPPILPLATLQPVLAAQSDCGPLTLVAPPRRGLRAK